MTTLRDYLRVVRRRKWIILQAIVLVPLVAVLFSMQQKHLYQGTAAVLLSSQNLALALTNTQDTSVYQQPDRIAQTQANLARVPTVARRTLAAAHVRESAQSFLSSSSVSPEQNANLLDFTVTNAKPLLAARLATEYAGQFTKFRRELDTAALAHARQDVQGRITALERAQQNRSPLYASLIEKDQQLAEMEALLPTNYVVHAATNATQVQPKPVRNGILGFLLGLVLGIGVAFLWEALDTRVRTAEEVGERLGLPLLARVPEPEKRLRTQDRIAMLAEPAGVHAESYRLLRTNLEFSNLERNARTIMITSALEGEGKSTTVANLAVALARAGKRVILVDLDLRRPFLDRFFDLNGQPGVTEVALGHATLADAIVPIAIAEPGQSDPFNGNGRAKVHGVLEVVRSGAIPPDAGEFVGTHALAEILAELRKRADIVLIDSPPLLQVGDAMTLSGKVDGVILITRLNLLKRPMLGDLHRMLETSTSAKLGFVLTGANLEEGYGYGGGYHYRSYGTKAAERAPVA